MSCMLAAIVCVVLGRVARTVWVIDGRVLAEGLGLFDEIGLVAGVCAKRASTKRWLNQVEYKKIGRRKDLFLVPSVTPG